jgi:carbamoyltransferase
VVSLQKVKGPILGIWDGHDAGACLVAGGRIISAINEERLTRRKLEVGFPSQSIKAVLREAGVAAAEVELVSVATTDFAKTLTRVCPKLKEAYYLLRRRLQQPSSMAAVKKMAKYHLTELPSSRLSRFVSQCILRRQLGSLGLSGARLELVDHHAAHAASAALCSGWQSGLVVTIDGIGDGHSGSLWKFSGAKLERLAWLDGASSLGIFFEHVTNLLNMRELEDEGKVMALANYAYPIDDDDNPLMELITVSDLELCSKYSAQRTYRELAKILWRYPCEQFAYMAQRVLEKRVVELVRNAVVGSGLKRVAYAGGVASNIKANMLLKELPEVEDLFVFPHMGDGGLAVGAALYSLSQANASLEAPLSDLFLGPAYSADEIQAALSSFPNLDFNISERVGDAAAQALIKGEIVMWFQGRMEYGPRALGARSILALPNSELIRRELNLKLKKRVWYQPFCPTMLASAARELLLDFVDPGNPFMTVAYRVRPEYQNMVQGVINVDGTCRPQVVPDDLKGAYGDLLRQLEKHTGRGVVLNTSFNRHGEPIVCTPLDALRAFVETDLQYLFMNNFVITKVVK